MKPLPVIVAATCATYFGVYRGEGRWSPQNRCGQCPIGTPCRVNGAAPARSLEELNASRATFVAAALTILEGAS